jgi:hypothetical protein
VIPRAQERAGAGRLIDVGVVAAWAALLAGTLALPDLTGSPTRGDDLTRGTVRLALACYAAAAVLMLRLRPEEWPAAGRGRLARWCWTLGWLAYLVHLGMAFHHYHGWSHAHAVEHTRQVSGVGEGIYLSHLFTLAWTVDVAWWWLGPRRYAGRPRWVGYALHSFMVFIIFNATVVYESGLIRWAGLAMFALLAGVWLTRRPVSAASR